MSPIWLWAHPRSRSTALERMMMERGDVTVLHEPLVSLLDEGRVSIPDGPYENQFLLFELAWSVAGTPPVVLDSDLLVRYPEETVRAYCAEIGLPYRPEAMRWPAGDRPEWERTAKWHVAAGRSTGFVTAPSRPVPLSGHLLDYYAHHRPFYDRMLEHALSLSPSEAPR
jgi:hypothetical protein